MAKRVKTSEPGELTILDYLNEDCWRAVLRFVPARDVMRTERASRRWQQVVLTYLQGVHISITKEEIRKKNKKNFNTCTLEPSRYKSFVTWTSKLGSSVVAAYCENWKTLETIEVTCPNLETLWLFNLPNVAPERISLNESFKNLKRLGFDSCHICDVTCISFMSDRALEELEFSRCIRMTGQCMNTINTSKLKSLVIKTTYYWHAHQLIPTVERLSELKRFTLEFVGTDIPSKIQLVLDRMPKLERLDIANYGTVCETFEPLCRLTRLRILNLNIQLDDEGVEAVTSCCKELRRFSLDCDAMTNAGAEALARHGQKLKSLKLVGFFDLNDDGVVAIVRGCPNLKVLAVNGAFYLTAALPARAQVAWREARRKHKLQLDVLDTSLEPYLWPDNENERYEDSISRHEARMRKLVIVLEPEDYVEGESKDDDDEYGTELRALRFRHDIGIRSWPTNISESESE